MSINIEHTMDLRPCLFPADTSSQIQAIGNVCGIIGRGLLTIAGLAGLSFLGVLPAIVIYL